MPYFNAEVDFPQRLLDAQNSDTLVIFAGAGVSAGPPSNLPTFKSLVDKIGEGVLAREPSDPLDYYLGLLAKRGTNVEELARRLIGVRTSVPRPLHEDLVALFQKSAAPRIVTTNFDTHFTTCARARFGEGLDIFTAPALPLGRRFAGIVYLHGSVVRLRDPLVLTDADFGRAYVTEGWATRFLVDMFATFTVLFAGYSHDDPIMRYLASGLAPGSRRFALTLPEESAKWRGLGIEAVEFPRRADAHKYDAQDDAVSAWATATAEGATDHAQRMRETAQGPPPVDRPGETNVMAAFGDAVRLRAFADHARSLEWLQWAEAHELLGPVFDRSGKETLEARLLAIWFAEYVAGEHSAAALAIARGHWLNMSQAAWTFVAMKLRSASAGLSPAVLAAWVAALLEAAQPEWSRDQLGFLLAACTRPDDATSVLLLFAELTRPRLASDLRFVHHTGGIELAGDPYDVDQGWKLAVVPQLDRIAPELEDVLTVHLKQAHWMLRAAVRANTVSDPVSYARNAIARSGSDSRENGMDLIIDIARTLLERSIDDPNGPHDQLWIRWMDAEPPVLRRLAAYGMAYDQQFEPDAALELLKSRQWIYAAELQPEVFALIARAYPAASEDARARFVREAKGADASGGDPAVDTYRRYALAVWLVRAAPGCPLAAAFVAGLQEADPMLTPPEHPDQAKPQVRMRWGPGPSPRTVDDLLAADPESLADLLIHYQPERSFDGPSRPGLLLNMAETATRSPDWGWRLATALAGVEQAPSDVWQVLIGTWLNVEVNDATDARLLSFLDDHPAIEEVAPESVASFLMQRFDGLPASALPIAERIIDRMTENVAAALGDERLQRDDGRWLTASINDPGGRMAQLWIGGLQRRRTDSGDAWSGIPEPYRRWLERAIGGHRQWAAMARVFLAGNVGFIYAIDPEWAKPNLLPLFDWDQDAERAEQAWHGFAILGRISSDPLLAELMPPIRQSFRRLDHEMLPVQRELTDGLVSIALYTLIDPVRSGWLNDFIREGGEGARRAWAYGMSRELRSLDASAAVAAWHQWISEYWERRITGVPWPLVPLEGTAMVDWIYGLKPVFAEVVGALCRTQMAIAGQARTFAHLMDSGLPATYPADTARLVERLLLFVDLPMYECDAVDTIVAHLGAAHAPSAILRRICDSMVRLGCTTGVDRANEINED